MENPESVAETNEVLMAILREMCELKQTEHTHISETSKAKAHRHNEVEQRGDLILPTPISHTDIISTSPTLH